MAGDATKMLYFPTPNSTLMKAMTRETLKSLGSDELNRDNEGEIMSYGAVINTLHVSLKKRWELWKKIFQE